MDNALLAIGSFLMGFSFYGLLRLLPWRLQMPFQLKTPPQMAEDHANGAHDRDWMKFKTCPSCVKEA